MIRTPPYNVQCAAMEVQTQFNAIIAGAAGEHQLNIQYDASTFTHKCYLLH